jgi:hypothetical protein
MVHALRRVRKSQTSILNSSNDRHERFQTNKFPLSKLSSIFSFITSKLYTKDMLDFILHFVSMSMIMNFCILKYPFFYVSWFICLSKLWINTLEMSVNLILYSTSTKFMESWTNLSLEVKSLKLRKILSSVQSKCSKSRIIEKGYLNK